MPKIHKDGRVTWADGSSTSPSDKSNEKSSTKNEQNPPSPVPNAESHSKRDQSESSTVDSTDGNTQETRSGDEVYDLPNVRDILGDL